MDQKVKEQRKTGFWGNLSNFFIKVPPLDPARLKSISPKDEMKLRIIAAMSRVTTHSISAIGVFLFITAIWCQNDTAVWYLYVVPIVALVVIAGCTCGSVYWILSKLEPVIDAPGGQEENGKENPHN